MKLEELMQEVKDQTRKVLKKLDNINPNHFGEYGSYYEKKVNEAAISYQYLESKTFPQGEFFDFIFWGGYVNLRSIFHIYLNPKKSTFHDFLIQLAQERINFIKKWLTIDNVDFNKHIPGIERSILGEICTGMDELIEPALLAGCNPNIDGNGPFGNTPLVWAIANDAKDTVITLIQLCRKHDIAIDLNKPSVFNKNTPLILCIAKGHKRRGEMSNYALTEFLLAHGADPNCQDAHGFTALHYAFLRRDKATVELLKKYNADFSIKNNSGEKPKDMLNSSYFEAHSKVFEITNGNDQDSCTFPSMDEFEQLKDHFIEDKNVALNVILKPRFFNRPSRPATQKGEGILPCSFNLT